MSYERLMNICSYGGFPARPIGVSKGRWSAMIKRVYHDLGIMPWR